MNPQLLSFLGAIPQPTFSPFLDKLQACDDDDELHWLLAEALRAEPYLLARVVNLANSVIYGLPGQSFYTPEACLQRMGSAVVADEAKTFFVEAALAGWLRRDTRSRSVWREAVFSANVAVKLDTAYCGSACNSSVLLSTLMSFLGELFLVGPVFEQLGPTPDLALYAQGKEGEIDPYVLTRLLVKKLALPRHIEETLLSIPVVLGAPNLRAASHREAATILLARSVSQRFRPDGVFVAKLPDSYLDRTLQILSLQTGAVNEAEALAAEVRKFLKQVGGAY